jgi:hypothetical protein
VAEHAGLSASDRAAYNRRTTPTSRSRFLEALRARQPQIGPNDFFVPEIDIARRALERGYGDRLEDFGINRERGAFDFTRGQQDVTRQRDEGVADIGTSRTRGTEDYTRALEAMQRRYKQQAQTQFEQAGLQGVRRGGTLAAAAKRRTENQQLEQQPVDTQQSRFLQDLGTRETRLRESADRSLGDLSLGYERQFGAQGDLTREEGRVRREFPISQYDLDLQGVGAAVNAGFVPSAAPKPKKKKRRR